VNCEFNKGNPCVGEDSSCRRKHNFFGQETILDKSFEIGVRAGSIQQACVAEIWNITETDRGRGTEFYKKLA
jgi:hypothetical protein